MKQIIRMNTFETNSSSIHSVVICTEAEYDAFINGVLLIDLYNEKFILKRDYTYPEITDETNDLDELVVSYDEVDYFLHVDRMEKDIFELMISGNDWDINSRVIKMRKEAGSDAVWDELFRGIANVMKGYKR